MDDDLFDLHAAVEQSHWWFVARRRIVRDLVRTVVPPRAGATVLDVGCGTGANLAALADEYRCVGVDISAAAIQWTQRRFPTLDVRHGPVAEIAADLRGQIDAALLLDVLEHVEDDSRLLLDTLDLLAPGGHVIVTVPAGPELWSEHDVRFGHYRRYTLDALRGLWRDLPVTERLVSYANSRLYLPIRIARTVSRRHARGGRTDLHRAPGPFNDLLRRIFSGEAARLRGRIDDPRSRPAYRHGVSLVAVLRKEHHAVHAASRFESGAATSLIAAGVATDPPRARGMQCRA